VYGLLGLYWALGGAGFPFGENDPGAALSVFGCARAELGAATLAYHYRRRGKCEHCGRP
jgi:hypothetical protein